MKQLIERIARSLVDSPDQVQVTQVEGERVVVFEVKVAPSDLGKIIGRNGRIANALRSVVKAAATKQGKKVSLEIIDDDR